MPSVVRCGLGPKSKIAAAFPLLRSLFIPIFLLLPNFSLIKMSGGGGDLVYFGMLAVMALSSGWGNAICLINGPACAQLAEDSSKVSGEMGDRIDGIVNYIWFTLWQWFVISHQILAKSVNKIN